MSKLVAFRMPDDLVEPFGAFCKTRGVSATEGMIRAVRLCVDAPEIRDTTAQTQAFVEVAKKLRPSAKLVKASELVETDEGYRVQVGPVRRAPGSLLKK
jgi:hypothetical protein